MYKHLSASYINHQNHALRGDYERSGLYMEKPKTVKELRELTGLSKAKFTERYKSSVKSVRNIEDWEHGRRNIPAYRFDALCTLVLADITTDTQALTAGEDPEETLWYKYLDYIAAIAETSSESSPSVTLEFEDNAKRDEWLKMLQQLRRRGATSKNLVIKNDDDAVIAEGLAELEAQELEDKWAGLSEAEREFRKKTEELRENDCLEREARKVFDKDYSRQRLKLKKIIGHIERELAGAFSRQYNRGPTSSSSEMAKYIRIDARHANVRKQLSPALTAFLGFELTDDEKGRLSVLEKAILGFELSENELAGFTKGEQYALGLNWSYDLDRLR
jgi:DNA-binding transcriptional regulator YiaG